MSPPAYRQSGLPPSDYSRIPLLISALRGVGKVQTGMARMVQKAQEEEPR